MAQLPIQRGGLAVTEYTYAASTASDKFKNNGRTVLLVKTGAAPTGTLAIVSVACEHGRTLDFSLAVAATKFYVIGPLAPKLFNDSNNDVTVTLSATGDCDVAAVAL